jgi:hypothetical protein
VAPAAEPATRSSTGDTCRCWPAAPAAAGQELIQTQQTRQRCKGHHEKHCFVSKATPEELECGAAGCPPARSACWPLSNPSTASSSSALKRSYAVKCTAAYGTIRSTLAPLPLHKKKVSCRCCLIDPCINGPPPAEALATGRQQTAAYWQPAPIVFSSATVTAPEEAAGALRLVYGTQGVTHAPAAHAPGLQLTRWCLHMCRLPQA